MLLLLQLSLRPVYATEVKNETVLSPFFFHGFDCSAPYHIRDITFDDLRGGCAAAYAHPVYGKGSDSYLVLQRESRRRVPAHRCRLTRTQVTEYCGNADHQTMGGWPVTFFNRPQIMTETECRLVLKKGIYTYLDNKGTKTKPISGNRAEIGYFYTGATWWSGSEFKCQGNIFSDLSGTQYTDVVVYRHDIITVEPIDIHSRDEGLQLMTADGLQLPCQIFENNCQTQQGIFVWNYERDYCPLARVRRTNLYKLSDTSGQTIYHSSKSDHHITLIDYGQVSMCGQVLTKTNLDNIFLFPLETNGTVEAFRRKIDPSEVNMQLYIDNKIQSVDMHFGDKLVEHFRKTLYNDCVLSSNHRRLENYFQLKDPGLTTYLIGNGTFATTAGDALYLYRCFDARVQARHTNQCYEALPIVFNGTNLFLEPITHRITAHGIPIPCSNRFYPKFKTDSGSWIMATPSIMPSTQPHYFQNLTHNEVLDLNYKSLQQPYTDWAKPGLYTQEDMAAMREYIEFPRIRNALAASLTMQAELEAAVKEGYVAAHNLFPSEFPNMTTYVLGKLWGWLMTWGEIVTFFISMYFLFRIWYQVLKWALGLWAVLGAHGCSRQLIWFPFMDLLQLVTYRRTHRNERGNDYTAHVSKTYANVDPVDDIIAKDPLISTRPLPDAPYADVSRDVHELQNRS